MLVCDECDYEVVHHQCLGLTAIPEEDWFCPPCAKKRAEMEKLVKIQRRNLKQYTKHKRKEESNRNSQPCTDSNILTTKSSRRH